MRIATNTASEKKEKKRADKYSREDQQLPARNQNVYGVRIQRKGKCACNLSKLSAENMHERNWEKGLTCKKFTALRNIFECFQNLR